LPSPKAEEPRSASRTDEPRPQGRSSHRDPQQPAAAQSFGFGPAIPQNM